MTDIEPIGSFQELDAEGFLVNPASPDKITAPWSEAVEAVSERYREHHDQNLLAIYVRGSVAKGTAIEGVSDVDSFAITREEPAVDKTVWRQVRRELRRRFPFSDGVEVQSLSEHALLTRKRGWRFQLRTQSACVWGEDLAPRIPPYRPDRQIVFHAPGLKRQLRTYRKLERPKGADCRWIAKAILRAGFDLVLELEGVYTRDLYLCYTTFAKHHPQQEGPMRRALELALASNHDLVEVSGLVDGLGEYVVKVTDRVLTL